MIACFFAPDQKTSWEDLQALAKSQGPICALEEPFCIWVEWPGADLPILPEGVRWGCAMSQWAAWIAAREGRGIVSPGQEALAVAAVELSEIELRAETRRRLHWLGLQTLADLQRLPEGALIELLGEEGDRLAQLAQGLDPEQPSVHQSEEELMEEVWLDHEDEGSAMLWQQLQQSIERLMAALLRRDQSLRALQIELEGASGVQRSLIVRWNHPPETSRSVWKSVCSRLQREPWTFAPTCLRLRPLRLFDLKSRQLTWCHSTSPSVEQIVALQKRGFLEGMMRLVWDNPQAAVPDERAHLEDLQNPEDRRSLCVPRSIAVQTTQEGKLQSLQTRSGWSQVVRPWRSWEVELRWWQESPLWRQYWIVWTDRLGPVRLFYEPLTERWYSH